LKRTLVAISLAVALTGCRQDMHDQPRYEAYERSDFFADRRASREPIPGTVARDHLREDDLLETGRVGEAFTESFPFPVTIDLVKRGQERYEIYCTPCHGRSGQGNGMVVERGYRRPPSFHIDRLRNERAGYLYDVITRGFGAMPDYSAQIAVRDRWAVVAYVRALQLSQNATLADVPLAARGELQGGGAE
jgi:hypothetical protein